MADHSANALADRELGDAPGRVVPMSELDEFEIADGYPEVRGWDVRDSTGRSIGYVYDLLADTAEMRVRYLDVLLDAEFAGSDADQRVLIPVESIGLDGSADDVLLQGIDAAEVRALVPYARRGVARETEVAFATPVGVADLPPTPGTTDAELPRERQYDDERLFARDATPTSLSAAALSAAALSAAAAAALTDDVSPTPAPARESSLADVLARATRNEPGLERTRPALHEEIEIERRALLPGEQVSDTHGDEIRIPIMSEEVVVERRLVAKEVLIIRKRRGTEHRPLGSDARRGESESADPVDRMRSIGPSGGAEERG